MTTKHIVRDVASGVLLIGGVATVVVGAEISAPMIAAVGAVTALGTGIYQAVNAPRARHRVRRQTTQAIAAQRDYECVER